MVQSTWLSFFAQAAILIPVFMLAVSFHEFSHALVAFLLGDRTAQKIGRMTLNPLAHIDPLGLLFLLVFRIGWAIPVPMNQNNFYYPRLFSVIAALAGPISNFLLALISLFIIKILPLSLLNPAVGTTAIQFFSALTSVNIMLGVFNLLPIPPLDGSHILIALISKHFPKAVIWLYRYGILILLVFFMLPQTQTMLFFWIKWTERFLKNLIF